MEASYLESERTSGRILEEKEYWVALEATSKALIPQAAGLPSLPNVLSLRDASPLFQSLDLMDPQSNAHVLFSLGWRWELDVVFQIKLDLPLDLED